VAAFTKALALAPDNVKARNALGVSLDALGRYAEAAAEYGKALAVDPDLDYVHNNIGYSRLLSGDRTGAAAAFARALELNPANAVARANLSRLPVAVAQLALQTADAPPAAASPAAAPARTAAAAEAAPMTRLARTAPTTPRPSEPASALRAAPGEAPRPIPAAPAALQVLSLSPGTPAPAPTLLVPVFGAAAGARGAAVNPGAVVLRRISGEELRRETAIEIVNASSRPELLAAVVAYLAAEGYRVEAGPAERALRTTAILYREGALQAAWQVAKSFPGDQEMKTTDGFARPGTAVRVLLGRDMVPRRAQFAVVRQQRGTGAAGGR
jgi:tetratricopeptide (TPR) repeat protein